MLKTRVRIIFLVCVLCILFPHSTLAKCLYQGYSIKGRIIDDAKNPIEHVLVLNFFDKKKIGYSGFTSKTGEYEIHCIYDTYKRRSLLGADVCGKTPSSLTLVVYAEHYRVKRKIIEAKKLKRGENEYVFLVPPIILHKRPSTQKSSQETPTEDKQEQQE